MALSERFRYTKIIKIYDAESSSLTNPREEFSFVLYYTAIIFIVSAIT